MAYEFDNNTADTTTYTSESLDLGNVNVPAKVSSVTAVTDKAAEKAAKKAEREAKKAAADAVKAAEKAAKAEERAEAKAAKEAAKASAKEEREQIRSATFQRVAKYLNIGDALAKQHDGYITKYVKNADADLYALLTDIHAFAEKVLASDDLDDVIKQMREDLRWDHEIKTQANSPALNIIVRYVTRTNRKNACVYARVIRKAMADGITSAELTVYIVKANGIDNIREAVAKKAVEVADVKTNAGMWEYAESYLKAQVAKPMATFKLGHEHSAYMADTARGGRFNYFVCEFDQGEYKVVDALWMDKDLEQQVLDRVYANLMQQTIFTQEDVDLRNAIEAKLGLKRAKPLVANAYTGD
jgi:hypothetical protein